MRTFLLAVVMLVTAPVLAEDSWVNPVLGGEHALRHVVQTNSDRGSFSGSFFLATGSISGEQKTVNKVSFSWQMADGTWAISSLPMEKLRVQLNERATTPTIKFRWRSPMFTDDVSRDDLQAVMNKLVAYAVINCRSKDWPVRIEMPLTATTTLPPAEATPSKK